jgi:hypothetical protein
MPPTKVNKPNPMPVTLNLFLHAIHNPVNIRKKEKSTLNCPAQFMALISSKKGEKKLQPCVLPTLKV